MEQYEMPVGFEMALARNLEAMKTFSNLTEKEKQDVLDGAHSVRSKEEMRQYVEGLNN